MQIEQDCIDLAVGVFQWDGGIHNEVGFFSFFFVNLLPRDQRWPRDRELERCTMKNAIL
jgi:hypothetical protein